MAGETIKVRQKSNPSNTRIIQLANLKIFQKRGWEAAEAVEVAPPAPLKKNDVKPVVVADAPDDTADAPFADVGDADVGGEDQEKTIDQLREEYRIASGKDPDQRWKEKRLTDEIAKLS